MNGGDAIAGAIAAIDARLAELDDQHIEEERAKLLTELESDAPMTDEQRRRVEVVAAADLARAERVPDGALTSATRRFLAELLAGSEVSDAVPASMTVMPGGEVYVVSAARGRVAIGSWDAAAIARGEREELGRERKALEARYRDATRGGLTRDNVIDAVIDNREPDGTWPTQEATAEALGVTDRRIRQVCGRRRWAGIVADAKARVAGG